MRVCVRVCVCVCVCVRSPCEFGADLLPGLHPLLIRLHGQDVLVLQLCFGGSVAQLDGQSVFPQHLLRQAT